MIGNTPKLTMIPAKINIILLKQLKLIDGNSFKYNQSLYWMTKLDSPLAPLKIIIVFIKKKNNHKMP